MSLKPMFLAFKKSCTICPNWGEGGGGNLDKILKNSNFFFVKPSLGQTYNSFDIFLIITLHIKLLNKRHSHNRHSTILNVSDPRYSATYGNPYLRSPPKVSQSTNTTLLMEVHALSTFTCTLRRQSNHTHFHFLHT